MEKVALHQLKFKVLQCESKPFGYVQRPLLKTKLWTFELFCFKFGKKQVFRKKKNDNDTEHD